MQISRRELRNTEKKCKKCSFPLFLAIIRPHIRYNNSVKKTRDMLTETINEAIKQAMLHKEKEKLDALRAIKSELLLLKANNPGTEITEEMEIKMLQRMIKQRKEAAETYKSQNREEQYTEEMRQAEVIAAFLPAQMSEAEIEAVIRQIIAESGVTDIKGMGKVMGLASKALAGKAENKTIAEKVKALLNQA